MIKKEKMKLIKYKKLKLRIKIDTLGDNEIIGIKKK